MAVQQEIKSQLAKLLATEDIVVEHKQVECAQFNVRTRVLILPLWEKASNAVYDMLVGHEVGHALFTPDEDWWLEHPIPQQVVNVVEDARIEKLMKRKYLGIAKSFYKGYNELYEQDYFELDGEDITSFNLADRANLHFKIGSLLDLSFSTPEKEIIDLISNAETFTQTLSAAEALYTFCQQEQERQDKREEGEESIQGDWMDDITDSQATGDSDSNSTDDNSSSIPDSDSSPSLEDRSDSSANDDRRTDSDVIVGTADLLQSKLQDLVNTDGEENVYIQIPKINLDTILVTNEEVHKYIDNDWVDQNKRWKESELPMTIRFDEIDDEFLTFKKDAQKEVSYLVKEFECRKAATSYARASTSRTGILSTEKLHTYRYNEDLFKKVTTLPDGKNHGLVFILDWSGSMQYVLQDTLKQLYNLMWFCKKVQIPFDVYAFTQEWKRKSEEIDLRAQYKREEGVFKIEDDFSLMNIFTSKTRSNELEKQMINMWRIAQCFRVRSLHTYPQRLCLSGTPLNESLICLHDILPKFQKENNVEKVQCIVLTDGEAHHLPYHKEVQRSWESEPFLGCRNINPQKCFLRDRKLGKTYKFGYRYSQFTDVILKNLKDNFPSVNFIGIRVLANRDAKSFMRLHCNGWEDEDMIKDWKKTKSFTIKNSGYDAYFGMSSSTLSEDADFEVEDDATKAQIKRAFVKSLKTKKLNKKVLGEFIELVA